MKQLTDRQADVLWFLNDFKSRVGYSPSIREIANDRVISIHAAYDYIKVLEKKGYIERDPGVSRGIRILKNADL